MSKIILTGDRPTGKLHIGHYAGSLRNRVALQNSGEFDEIYIMLADAQALTDNFDAPEKVRENIREVVLDYLSVGIDPSKSHIFIQSQISALFELTVYYMNLVTVARAERNPTVKSEIQLRGFNSSIPMGFLAYPISQAADITAFDANIVPVGEDQAPMLEQCHEIVQRFNNFYGVEYFKEPVAYNFGEELIKIPGLDGSGKMGKSEGNCIFLSDSAKEIERKVKRALTDSGPTEPNSVKPDYIENLFTIMRVVSTNEVVAHYEEKWNSCQMRYGDMKKQLATDIIAVTTPIRERILELEKDDDYLRRVVTEGAEKAHENASKTIADVRKIMGFKSF